MEAIRIQSERRSIYEVNPEEATTHLEYLCNLATENIALHGRQVKILCTLGKVSRDVPTIEKLIEDGMNIARITLGQGLYEYHSDTIRNVRTAVMNHSKKLGRPYPLALAVDLKGAEIRTGYIADGAETIELKVGAFVKLTTEKIYYKLCNEEYIYVDYENITKVVKEGNTIYLNQGYIELRAIKVSPHVIDCKIITGGKLKSYFQINLPSQKVDLPPLTEQDKNDILFAVKEEVDMIIVSFVRDEKGVLEAKKLLGHEGKGTMIMAKIESKEGIDNFSQIAHVADGIVIGRGDLGIELCIDKIFLAQKYLIAMSNLMNKPVFVVSQLMESMITNPRPTRSEVSDVANLVLDGIDVLCLAKETTKGQYLSEVVKTVGEISTEAEACIWRKQTFKDLSDKTLPPVDAYVAIAMCAVQASMKVEAAAIIIVTHHGNSARVIAKFRPRCPILAITRVPRTSRNLCAFKGIIPFLIENDPSQSPEWIKDLDDRIQKVITIAKKEHIIKVGQPIIVLSGWKQGLAFTNTMRIIYVPAVSQSILY